MLKLFIIGIVILLISGCSTLIPEPITRDEMKTQVDQDLQAMFAGQEEVKRAITLEEAIARTLKYNLSNRVVMMEETITRGTNKLTSYDLLPQLTTKAGYNSRSKFEGSTSISLVDGSQSLVASTSQEKVNYNAGLGISWNILDLGVSYASAKQTADQVLISQQLQRKSVQNIVYDVQVAWWRAAVAQQLMSEINDVLEDTKKAIQRSRVLEQKRIKSPEIALNDQKTLMNLLQRLIQLKKQMSTAIIDLASLMNLQTGTKFTIELPTEDIVPQFPKMEMSHVEVVALLNRPELLEANYNKRVSLWETKKTLFKLFPGVDLSSDYNWDSNKYTVYKNWAEVGTRLSWNIMNLITYPDRYQHAKSIEGLQDMKRMALSIAVIAQVNIAWQDYQSVLSEFYLAKEQEVIEGKLKKIADSTRRAQRSDELSAILSKVRLLNARTISGLALADLQGVVGRIYNSVGIDQMPHEVESHNLTTLSHSIKRKLASAKSEFIKEIERASGKPLPRMESASNSNIDSLFSLLSSTNQAGEYSFAGNEIATKTTPSAKENPTFKSDAKKELGTPSSAIFKEAEGFFHNVQKGETLFLIAQKYSVNLDDLMQVNLINNPTRVSLGRDIWIPAKASIPQMPPIHQKVKKLSKKQIAKDSTRNHSDTIYNRTPSDVLSLIGYSVNYD